MRHIRSTPPLAATATIVTALALPLPAAHAAEPQLPAALHVALPAATTTVLLAPDLTCHLTQAPTATMDPGIELFPLSTYINESGRNPATTDCSSTYATRVTSQVIIEDLGVIQHRKDGVVKVGAGYGPVTGTASQNVPDTEEPGPEVRFTFISTLTTNTGATGRVCQSATISLVGLATAYANC